ncbi:MAG: adenylyl-sulfate kinase [Alphaproteobacteria bacterium]|nr:adenylyl-sulfate kinase [Alphaproteobacteria bacterium]
MDKGLLKFITCGSVDDGKSTLIGHMLYDAKLLFTDQEKALQLDSKVGSNDGEVDYSLLLDGLMAEREQGITIDVAYRYFTTEGRSFIVADTPGHEEYTRNMAVGASFAELAVILVDASKGILVQTRRHSRICALMGIKHFVFAINKMDLVKYDEETFNKIVKDIRKLMAEFNYDTLQIIPVSATVGDNVTKKSESMSWYDGPTLLNYLENVNTTRKVTVEGFCMPVQRVCRPNSKFRGFQGEISSGDIGEGDDIKVLPSGETSTVLSVYECDKQVKGSREGKSVTIQLKDEIDISRGDVLVSNKELNCQSTFVANVLWMDSDELKEGKNYLLKLGTRSVPATISKIRYKVDVNTGEHVEADSLAKNELAVCEIMASSKLVFDKFCSNRDLGSFILIDRISHATSACGTVSQGIEKNENVVWHNMDINREHREKLMNQKAVTLWFTGLSGSGKSTIANLVDKKLYASGYKSMLLDGDNIRFGLNSDLGFSQKDRSENIRRIAETSKLMNEAGLIVLTAFISPFVDMRRRAREIIGDSFIEVFIDTSLEECEKRDPKGLYKSARAGKIKDFTGIDSDYEEPVHPELIIKTEGKTPEDCADEVLRYLEKRIK